MAIEVINSLTYLDSTVFHSSSPVLQRMLSSISQMYFINDDDDDDDDSDDDDDDDDDKRISETTF